MQVTIERKRDRLFIHFKIHKNGFHLFVLPKWRFIIEIHSLHLIKMGTIPQRAKSLTRVLVAENEKV